MGEKGRNVGHEMKLRFCNLFEKKLGKIWWTAIQKLPRDVKGTECLDTVKEQLKTRSCLTIYNHLAIFDSLLLYDVLDRNLKNPDINYTIPASIKFWDGRIGFPGARTTMELLRDERRIDFVRVIQHYDDHYTTDEKKTVNEGMIGHMSRILSQSGRVVPYAPEGGRSQTAQMEYAQKGIERIMKNIPDDTLVLPTVIWGSEKVSPYGSVVPRPFYKTHIQFLTPMTVREAFGQAKMFNVQPRDLLMLKLTEGLPKEYWGVYNEDNFPDYFKSG